RDHSGTHGEGSHRENIHGEGTHGGVPLQTQQDFIRPFDLSSAPLLRVGLSRSEDTLYMMLDMHHIISDGVSHDVLTQDFLALFDGKEEETDLPPLRIHYKDFAHWQNNEREKKFMEGQAAYWLSEFKGDVPILNILTDYSRPVSQSFEGDAVIFNISGEMPLRLRTIAVEQQLTLYMLLLGTFYILLAKLSGQEDIVVGTPVAGRRHADLEKVIGMFVNTLALRNQPSNHLTVRDFLTHLKKRTLEAFENQEYSFEELVEQVDVKRDISRNPLFDVMFSLLQGKENATEPDEVQPGQTTYTYEHRVSKFDLSLEVVTGDKPVFVFEYCTKLFKEETIQRFTGYFRQLLRSVTGDIDKKISDIQLLTEEEKKQLLVDFNGATLDYPQDQTVVELFQRQVEKTPSRVAVTFENNHVTYNQFNHRANCLASQLIEKGTGPGTIVAIIAEQSVEMLTSIFGVLKAGGAYLPIDPEYPEERIEFMLKDSGARILLKSEIP
ncbi:MAG: AMP-binding protein, partial [bacterium]|nr:AMP-binding protein [bacterium]